MCTPARLGLVAGALLYAPASRAAAQVVVPPTSVVPIPARPANDSAADTVRLKADSIKAKADSIKADSIKAPIGRFSDPALYEIGPQYEWNRAQLFAAGALTVVDLLDRIPGVTTFRSGWLSTPQTATYNASFQRVRVFYDGIEIDNLDSRNNGPLDLSTVQLWSLEHLSIERSAGELRIYMRSWRVDNTDPYTRVDIATGNEDTNLYHGFYGKRFNNGGVLQLAGQQYRSESLERRRLCPPPSCDARPGANYRGGRKSAHPLARCDQHRRVHPRRGGRRGEWTMGPDHSGIDRVQGKDRAR